MSPCSAAKCQRRIFWISRSNNSNNSTTEGMGIASTTQQLEVKIRNVANWMPGGLGGICESPPPLWGLLRRSTKLLRWGQAASAAYAIMGSVPARAGTCQTVKQACCQRARTHRLRTGSGTSSPTPLRERRPSRRRDARGGHACTWALMRRGLESNPLSEIVTASHRVLVKKGDRMQTMPARLIMLREHIPREL